MIRVYRVCLPLCFLVTLGCYRSPNVADPAPSVAPPVAKKSVAAPPVAEPLVAEPTVANPPSADSGPFTGKGAGDPLTVAGVELCWCPAGKFTMGSPPSELERRPGEDQVVVTLTKGFWIGKFEVAQAQWRRVMGSLPAEMTAGAGDEYPIYAMTFAEAEDFCSRLTAQTHAAGDLPPEWEFRLPTEAQWEYACRAGTRTATAQGDSLSRLQANFQGKPYGDAPDDGPSHQQTTLVGSYLPNAWNVYEMHGNVYEWTRDWYHPQLPGGSDPDLHDAFDTAQLNRTGDRSRVRRGGCWADEGWPCRSAMRVRFEPHRRTDHIGMRVVLVRK